MGVIPRLRPRLCQRCPTETAGVSGPGKEDANEVLQRERPARRQVRGEPRFGSLSHGLQGPVERTNNSHGLRSLAANLARRIGPPNLTLIYESDAISRWRFLGRGPTVLITDLGLHRPDPLTLELTLTAVHSGVHASDVSKATSWDWPSLGTLIRLSPA